MSQVSDEELIAAVARGNGQAMDTLVFKYHGRLLDFAFRHLGNREAAADIAQTVLIRVFEAAGRYGPQASFRTWLYTVALNLIRDEFRRRRARKESLASELRYEGELENLVEGTTSVQSPEDEVLAAIESSALWKAVAELPENHKTAVILRFREGLTYEEIAQVTRAPVGTVKSWIHYALKKLKQALEPAKCED